MRVISQDAVEHFVLILWTNISHSTTISIPWILEKSSPHINLRRSSKPVPYYHNSSATIRLLLFGDIESSPGPVNPIQSNRNRKQNKFFSSLRQECNKTVKTNYKRLLCIHCNNLFHLKYIGTNSKKRLKSHDPQRWICYRCYLKELPFFNTQNLLEEIISITDQTTKNNVHSEAFKTNRNHLSITHLNIQSMSSTFDEFQVMLYQHPFDVIRLSETWLRNDTNLQLSVQIRGYSFCYKSWDERRGDGVGMYIKDTKKYKDQLDLSKLDETIEYMWIECQGNNKNKDYLVGVFYQPQRKTDMDSKAR